MTPAEMLLAKRLVASGLSSAEAEQVCASLRERAFFSARIESVRFLQDARKAVADYLAHVEKEDGTMATRADAISAIMRRAREEGISTGTGGVTDPGSVARARLVADTNAAMAAGYCQRRAQGTRGARLAFPGLRLVRVEDRVKPRNWMARWNVARQSLGAASSATAAASPQGPFVALKEDPIWAAISRFGMPYPPFDFNSGMGVEEVPFDECKALGLVTDDYDPRGDIDDGFNRSMETELEFRGENDPEWKWLKKAYGDQITREGGKIKWSPEDAG